MGNPCTNDDMNFFYAATFITPGDGKKTPIWETPWVDDRKSKDVFRSYLRHQRERNGVSCKPCMRIHGLKILP
jgi:hypothetical protein